MAIFLNTKGNSLLSIAICDRCRMKYPTTELSPDRNTPGLMVCRNGCNDEFDPWRLPARPTEDISLPFYRPDVPLGIQPDAAALDTYRITEGGEYRLTEDDEYRILEIFP